MNYLEQSKKTKEEANFIFENTKILEILEKFGEYRIGGSYFLDLMYSPDIDINVKTENPRESAINFLSEIISKRLFQKYQYGDFEKFPRKNRPKAHIIVLILELNNRKWEIEIWFDKEFNQENIDFEEKIKALPKEKKELILKKKELREKSGLDKHNLSSFEIYKEVLGKK